MSNSKQKSNRVALLGVFSAIVIVLQLLSYVMPPIGTFRLSLVLIPIVLGAVLYGPKFGGILGLVFGVVVTVSCAVGLDVGGEVLFVANPFLTAFLCLLKGALAGFVAGLVAHPLKDRKPTVSTILAAITAPVVNTGVFILCLSLFFKNILIEWAGGTALVYYVIFSLVGINFLIELAIDLFLSPALLSVISKIHRIH